MNQQLDPVSVAVVLFTVLFSPELAEIVGHYAVIILSATTGAAWSLGEHESTSRIKAFWFIAKINLTAILLTVGIVKMMETLFPGVPGTEWLLAPVALLVGGIGNNWPAIGRWCVYQIGRLLARRTGEGS